MKADDFRSLSVGELDHRINELKKDLFKKRMQLHSNQLTNTNNLRDTRRDIARASTIKQEMLAQQQEGSQS